ncbi:MAG: gamma-glutamyl-gamma-aminobutyrate hydrolase family protein [Candidatus Mcinerneyibacterium aminivorans]|uniref:Gamma-glutamyl-gamma-aminobutyrate hydrolase family protein n=1 Tax=Candidatus Mcinerneyibacterium aminivorans TaxID=2703815 RepID=A0A5D0MIV8_9BACT|nr:MAG: gamma-glutamyl-gamma-aminobutyrate hydrolase family protein [Candidatus Mcinerneyibacterium aminivorans]
MTKPVIGITSSLLIEKNYKFPGYKRIYINKDYLDSIILSEGIPLIIPVTSTKEMLENYISQIDGLLLSGGVDIDPARYGENPYPELGEINPDKDNLDFTILNLALEKDIPVLGICRGMQVLNIYYEGTLYQDVSQNKEYILQHYQNEPDPSLLGHFVNVEENSKLFEIVKNKKFRVNSYHHQFIKYHSKKMRISAKSDDNAIEAIETDDDKFIIGVQWHPERIYHQSPESKVLFDNFVKKSK